MEILRHFAFVRSSPLLRQKHVQLGPSAVPEDRSFCKSERFILCALSGSGQIRPTDHQAQIFVADTVPLSGLQAVGCQHLHSCTACWCRYRESWSVTVADKGSVVKRYHEVLAKSDLLVALYIIGGGSSKSSGFGHIRPWMSEPNSVQIHPADGPKCWTDWSQTSWLLRITWINWTISNGWHSWIFKWNYLKLDHTAWLRIDCDSQLDKGRMSHVGVWHPNAPLWTEEEEDRVDIKIVDYWSKNIFSACS